MSRIWGLLIAVWTGFFSRLESIRMIVPTTFPCVNSRMINATRTLGFVPYRSWSICLRMSFYCTALFAQAHPQDVPRRDWHNGFYSKPFKAHVSGLLYLLSHSYCFNSKSRLKRFPKADLFGCTRNTLRDISFSPGAHPASTGWGGRALWMVPLAKAWDPGFESGDDKMRKHPTRQTSCLYSTTFHSTCGVRWIW